MGDQLPQKGAVQVYFIPQAFSSYSRVCGRIIGYQVVTPDGFRDTVDTNINQSYMDGVSITYGIPRTHIWSYTLPECSKKARQMI